MKEFISIVCVLLAGLLAFTYFSAKSVADSTAMAVPSLSPQVMQCYGSNTMVVDYANIVTVAVPCTTASFPSSTTNYICSANVFSGLQYTSVGVQYEAQGYACGSWPNGSTCYNYYCYVACAPVTSSTPEANCQWGTPNTSAPATGGAGLGPAMP